MSDTVKMWVVYDHPVDFPGQFVARRFEGNKATEFHYAHASLSDVRDWVYRDALTFGNTAPYQMRRHPSDPAVIFETWM
jgi:hypothetical protein